MRESIRGRTILVSGATRGIGAALARELAARGARLALTGRDSAALAEISNDALRLGATAVHAKAFDLRDERAIVDFHADALRALGPLDVLINNAGFNPRKAPLAEVTTEEFDDALAVNLRAPFVFLREAFRDMKRRGSGHVVNVLSTVCHFANENMGAYTAAKAGLDALTAIFRKEARVHGIRVTSVYPGGTNTTFRSNVREDYSKPESVARAILSVLELPDDVVVHELTFRPMVESNF
jgi:NAD(P)-dependent dehydrogenase (short-subunit alcohol dehydrogenase family)